MKTIFFTLLFFIMSLMPAQAQDKNLSIYHKDVNIYLDVEVEKLSDSKISLRAFTLTRPGKYQKAIDFCDKVLRHKPHNAEAHFRKGRALAMLDRDEEAVDSYNFALKYKYKFIGELHYHKGLSLAELERYAEAVDAYDLALKNGFTDRHVYYAKYGAEIKLGRL